MQKGNTAAKVANFSPLRQLALQGAIASGTLEPNHFALTLKGKYAPRWVSEAGLSELFTYEQAMETLSLDAIKKRCAEAKTPDEIASIGGRLKGVANDIEVMRVEFDETTRQAAAASGDSAGAREASQEPEQASEAVLRAGEERDGSDDAEEGKGGSPSTRKRRPNRAGASKGQVGAAKGEVV